MSKKKPERFYTRRCPWPSQHVVIIRDLEGAMQPIHVHESDAEFVVAAMNEKNAR